MVLPSATRHRIPAATARPISTLLTGATTATGAATGRGAATGAGRAAVAGAAPPGPRWAAAGAPKEGAGVVPAVPAPVGPPGGRVGSLMVGAAEGFGGRLMRTVSFLGWTFPVSFFGGIAPAGVFGMFSAIKSNLLLETKGADSRCQTHKFAGEHPVNNIPTTPARLQPLPPNYLFNAEKSND